MVLLSALAITIDSEHWMCGGFSLGETIRLGSFEFIVDNMAPLIGGVTQVQGGSHTLSRLGKKGGDPKQQQGGAVR
jgi:hypothetical protein